MKKLKLKLFRLIPSIIRWFNPTYSHCSHCGLPWNIVEEKSIMFTKHKGFFIVCIDCWKICSLNQLKKYLIKCYIKNWNDGTLEIRLEALKKEYNLK